MENQIMKYIKLIPVSVFIVLLFNTCEKDDQKMVIIY